MRVTIDLDDDDLKHFRLIIKEARSNALRRQPDDIVASAEALLAALAAEKTPRFVKQRLSKLELMIRMLTDHEWRLPKKDSNRVLNALAYFTDPEDLIPDHVPGIGYLDDAIMIELVVRDLNHEIDAYEDFCEYRASGPPIRGVKNRGSVLNRENWLERRRRSLQERMRRRRSSSGRRIL